MNPNAVGFVTPRGQVFRACLQKPGRYDAVVDVCLQRVKGYPCRNHRATTASVPARRTSRFPTPYAWAGDAPAIPSAMRARSTTTDAPKAVPRGQDPAVRRCPCDGRRARSLPVVSTPHRPSRADGPPERSPERPRRRRGGRRYDLCSPVCLTEVKARPAAAQVSLASANTLDLPLMCHRHSTPFLGLWQVSVPSWLCRPCSGTRGLACRGQDAYHSPEIAVCSREPAG